MFEQSCKKFSIDPKRIAPRPDLSALQTELDEIRKRAPKPYLIAMTAEEFLQQLPKAELHLHSTAMADIFTTAQLAWDISARTDQGLQKSQAYGNSIEKLIEDFLKPQPGNLEAYLHRYDLLKNYIILDLDAVRETSYKGAINAFRNGAYILEIRTSIKAGQFGDPRSKSIMQGVGYTAYEELCARIEGFQKAEKESSGLLDIYLIISFRRQEEEANSMALLDDIIKYREDIKQKFGKDYIVGVDIAGSEYMHEAKKFRNVFRRARKQGLKVTAHAGEEQGAGEGSIWQAINSGAHRIGHGTCLYRPWSMLPFNVRQHSKGLKKNAFILSLMFGTAYEMCLTSNIICGAETTTGYTPDAAGKPLSQNNIMKELSDYPALMLFSIGSLVYHGRSLILPIPCTDGIYTLNTDIVREYALMATTFGLGVKQILAVARYSIRHSFAPKIPKSKAMVSWRDFASNYLFDPEFALPDTEAKRALHIYRQQIRNKLGITSQMVERIAQEVHSSHHYLKDYLYDSFHEMNEKLEV